MTGKRTPLPIPWFTLLMAGALIATAIATGTLADPLEWAWRKVAGFGPMHLPRLEFTRLFTSAFLTSGGWHFFRSLSMLLLCTGAAEWVYGTRRAAGCFWSTHLVTLIVESVLFIVAFRWLQHPLTQAVLVAHDVGPSAGYYGCLGFALAAAPLRFRRWAVAATAAILWLRLGTTLSISLGPPNALSGDVAHLLAFGFGLCCARLKPFAADAATIEDSAVSK